MPIYKSLKLMERVRRKRERIIITKRGKPAAQMVPIEEPPEALFGLLKGSLAEEKDLIAPIDEAWEADAE